MEEKIDQRLNESKISEWALIIDILGTKSDMGENIRWLKATVDILTLIQDVAYQSLPKLDPKSGPKIYQYGDTINVFSNDTDDLTRLAKILQNRLFSKDILCKMAISSGGVYDLSNIDFLNKIKSRHSNLVIQCLLGRAVARGHMLMTKAKGPRIILDEERSIAVVPNVWEKRYDTLDDIDIPRSELIWWDVYIDIDDEIKKRIEHLNLEKNEINKINKQSHQHENASDRRRLKSIDERIIHLKHFLESLEV